MLLIEIWNSHVNSELNNAFLFVCESLWESVPFDGCSGCQWKSLYWWQDFDWEKKWKLGQPKKVALPISRSKLDLEAHEIPSIKRWDSWKDQQNKISKSRSGCIVYHCRGPGQEMLGNKVSMITVGAIVAEESHQGTWFDSNAPNEAEKLGGSSLNIKDTVNLKSEMEDSKNLGLSRLQMIAMWLLMHQKGWLKRKPWLQWCSKWRQTLKLCNRKTSSWHMHTG